MTGLSSIVSMGLDDAFLCLLGLLGLGVGLMLAGSGQYAMVGVIVMTAACGAVIGFCWSAAILLRERK